MKLFFTAILFLSLTTAEALAQSTIFQQAGPLVYEHLNHAGAHASFNIRVAAHYHRLAADAPRSHTAVPLIRHIGTSSTQPRLWPQFPSYGMPPADSVASVPFAYRTFDHRTRCSGGAVEPFQIASCIGSLGFDTPALNRVQTVVVHVMRHYSSQEAVRVNRDCVRSLSCSSLYEKSVVQRIALRPPKSRFDALH